jgi:4-hydroxybutyrate dehydrogenase/sulfolactaldehyde 3-reductase
MERVGYVGLGAIGRPMAANIVKKGFPLTVFDVNPAAGDPLVALGARKAGTLAGVIESSDVVFMTVPNSPDVEQVVLGAGGLLEHARPGMMIVDCSTIYPEVTDKVAQAVQAKGLAFVDAAIGRQPVHAERGELMFMVGATDADMTRVRPILDTMGTTIVHVGPPGTGIRIKLVNNLLAAVTNMACAEAVAFALKLGLSFDRVMEVLTGTAATAGHLTITWPNKILKGDVAPGFSLKLQHKDLGLALRLAEAVGAPMGTSGATMPCFEDLLGRGFGDKDFSAALAAACEAAGVATPKPRAG